MACVFEKSKPGFPQTHDIPQRAPPCQLLAQVTQIGQGAKKNELFHPIPSPNASSPQCMGWEQELWPDGEEDPKGAGIPRMSAARPCSQLCAAIWLVSPHRLGTDWECSIGFWPHKSRVSLQSKMRMRCNTRRWAGNEAVSLDLQRMLNFQGFMFLEEQAQTLIKCNSWVHQAGDWRSHLMLFKVCCLPLSVTSFFSYRNAFTRFAAIFLTDLIVHLYCGSFGRYLLKESVFPVSPIL